MYGADSVSSIRLEQVDQESVKEFVQRRMTQGPAGDSWYIQESTATQKFLLVHQTAHQKSMLERYGKVIVGLDATYKTSKWGFPLFLVNVVNNHGKGLPVALFFVQQETTEMVTLALKKCVLSVVDL